LVACYHDTVAKSLDWKISVFGKFFYKHFAHNLPIFLLDKIWLNIPVLYYGLLLRNRGYIEFETLEKQCWSYLRNIKTAINYFFYKHFAHNLPIFLLDKIWLNIGICQTLGFSILKMSSHAVMTKLS
jgi:hypothetical protein